MKDQSAIVEILKGQFGDAIQDSGVFRGQLSVTVGPERIAEICAFCRDDERLAFAMLTDLTAVDFLPRTPRFEVVYNLYSFRDNDRLRLKVPVEENQTLSTVEGIWRSANWLEREVY